MCKIFRLTVSQITKSQANRSELAMDCVDVNIVYGVDDRWVAALEI